MVYPRSALLALAAGLSLSLGAQTLHRSPGMVPAQIRSAFDLGVAPADRPLSGMLLLLKRTPQQEAELQQLLVEQQTPGAPNYHHWLSPAEFGRRFGASDAALAQATGWLRSQGFTVNQVAAGRNVIQFSGTAGAVAEAFHTEIHQFAAAGRTHWANVTNPAIPADLAGVVQGVVSLNDFVKPAGHFRGQGQGRLATPAASAPALTFTDNGTVEHALVPGDFAVLYNVAPLYSATTPINGQGQTIAIVGRSDVNMADIQNFRNLFVPSNPSNLPVVIHNGPAPGEIPGDEDEADLDLEWSGGIAPNATIDFVVSATTDTTDGVDLSAEYIVDHNLAPVMSTSFAACEAGLGTNENSFVNSIYEQAAAQGITVIDSSGDSGAAGCDPNDGSEAAATQGLAVSGLASTPFDTGVGGSMFNEGSNSGSFWSASNDPTTHASALGPIPEAVWNESCLNAGCDSGGPLSASGGGKSLLYGKPIWQQAPGVPSDGARDVPDVAFAAAGHDGYVVCAPSGKANDPTCVPDSQGHFGFFVFAGTSASAPSFAGVMALVNQKTGSIQGLANPTLYALASSAKQNYPACDSNKPPTNASCIFLDVTQGNNSVPCAGGSPGCSSTKAGTNGTLTGYSAGPGYDQATGLGSINVANLVTAWATATTPAASTTTLSISPVAFTHGTAVHVHVEVTRQGGTLGPTGDVALIAQLPGGGTAGVDFGTLQNGGANCSSNLIACLDGTEQGFPGGAYTVVARYAGDSNFAPSTSNAVALTVAPEASQTTIAAFEANAQGQELPITKANYGDLVFLDSQVQGAAQVKCGTQCSAGIPSGTVTFTNSGAAFTPPGSSSNVLALNSEGAADFPGGVTTIPPGSYSLTASYSGDTSFNPSASAALALTVNQAVTGTHVTSKTQGASTVLTATVGTSSLGQPPTGSVSFFSGTTLLGSGAVTGGVDPNSGFAEGTATLTLASVPAGPLVGLYSGDTNYAASLPVITTATTTTATVAAGASATYNFSLTPENGFAGTVALTCAVDAPAANCTVNPASLNLSGSAAGTATATVTTTQRGLVPPPFSPPGGYLYLLALLGLLTAAARSRRFRLVGALALAGCAVACGGGSSSGGGGGGGTGTTAGTYTVTITATSGAAASTTAFSLVVQ